ncbi:hypothetical protein [Bradyrhizobium sp. AZCC 1693]|uniref:hypothetical protein n=1 Tax=Bradyrhizobium sp. AZCC 1693 TaxID=3117029 RepID=UPI002FF1D6CA
MGSGNINVGNDTPTRKPGQPAVENGSGPRIDPSLKPERQEKAQGKASAAGLCGAMSQQNSEFRGNVSAPQQLVHLVGCRDRKAGFGPEARQYSKPLKR